MPQRPLVELNGSWVYRVGDRGVVGVCGPPQNLTPADLGATVGVSFECPACPGGHRIAVPFEECPKEARWCSGDAAWKWVAGDSLQTLIVSPSIDCSKAPPCTFHGHVGRVRPGWVSW